MARTFVKQNQLTSSYSDYIFISEANRSISNDYLYRDLNVIRSVLKENFGTANFYNTATKSLNSLSTELSSFFSSSAQFLGNVDIDGNLTASYLLVENDLNINGSLNITNSITGSLYGTASVALNSLLLNGTSSSEFSSNSYVNEKINNLGLKQSVIAKYDFIGGTLSGISNVDGISISSNDRILVIDQSNGINSGIYLASTGTWSRSSDYISGSSAAATFMFVQKGDNYADTCWFCTNDSGSDIIETNSLIFEELGEEYTASVGLQLNNKIFSIGTGSITTTMISGSTITQEKLNLSDPISNLQAATKQYVDTNITSSIINKHNKETLVYPTDINTSLRAVSSSFNLSLLDFHDDTNIYINGILLHASGTTTDENSISGIDAALKSGTTGTIVFSFSLTSGDVITIEKF